MGVSSESLSIYSAHPLRSNPNQTISADEIQSAISERLSEATMDENHTCLLDACVEAASRYEA